MTLGSKLRHGLFALYTLLCLAAMTWPLYDWFGNGIEPTVLGVPYSLAWVVGWVLATFVALILYHGTGGRDGGAPGDGED